MTALDDVVTAVRAHTYRYADEMALHRALDVALASTGLQVRPEAVVDEGRIDYLVGDDVGVEVKVAGSSVQVLRQMTRYARSAQVGSLVLVTTRPQHRMPTLIEGVETRVVRIGWL